MALPCCIPPTCVFSFVGWFALSTPHLWDWSKLLHVARVSPNKSFLIYIYFLYLTCILLMGCFHFEALMNDAKNNPVCILGGTHVLTSVDKCLEAKSLRWEETCFSVSRYLSNISTVVETFTSLGECLLFHTSLTLGIANILIFAALTSVRVSYCSYKVYYLDNATECLTNFKKTLKLNCQSNRGFHFFAKYE